MCSEVCSLCVKTAFNIHSGKITVWRVMNLNVVRFMFIVLRIVRRIVLCPAVVNNGIKIDEIVR